MDISKQLAPILLFVYARAEHTKRTLDALAANDLAKHSDLVVYADAPRKHSEEVVVNEVRSIVKSAQGFQSVTVIERQTNYGLARNIIEGVSEVCNRHGRVIVLEDDLVTSPSFLTFMNAALDRYEDDKQVWHISGWNYPINSTGLGDAFFLRVMNCWGWATWADRWQHYEKNTDKLIAEFDRRMIRSFDLDGSGVFWSQVMQNKQSRLNTWAIYWYATIFMQGGLCLNPAISYIHNIGLDGSGTHGSKQRQEHTTVQLNQKTQLNYPDLIVENETAIRQIIQFYQKLKPSLASRILGKLTLLSRRLGIR